MAIATCVLMFKNGNNQYVRIPDYYDGYEWNEEEGLFSLFGRKVRYNHDTKEDEVTERTRLAQVRLKAINGYFFETDED